MKTGNEGIAASHSVGSIFLLARCPLPLERWRYCLHRERATLAGRWFYPASFLLNNFSP